MNDPISHQEIAAYVEGIADKATSRRVLRAALTESSVRERLTTLEAHDDAFKLPTAGPFSEATDDRLRRIQASLRNAVLAIAMEPTPASSAPPVPAHSEHGFAAQVQRVLQIGRQLIALPCLAPVTAAPAADSHIHRQTVQTGDGVRIEFQQLPGSAPFRLRVLVDASQIQQGDDSTAKYNVAYLTLEDSGSGESIGAPPDRHLLIVPLNDEARGFADFVIGANTGKQSLPAPAGSCQLVSATLAHES